MLVLVTPRAEKNFDSIVNYIKDTWGEKTDALFRLLKNYPSIGQVENGDIRGFQLSPRTRILYRIRDKKIIILAFFDVRQDPKKKFD